MTDPSQYFRGRTVQEQMNEVIGYVDVRSAEVATDAIASDVAQVHSDAADAHADALAAAASAAAAAGTLTNAVKKTGEASQSIDGDIDLNDDLNVDGDATVGGALSVTGAVTVPTPVNNTDAANKKYVDDADALKISISDINSYAVGLTGNQGPIAGIKTFSSKLVAALGGTHQRLSNTGQYLKFAVIETVAETNYAVPVIIIERGIATIGEITFAITGGAVNSLTYTGITFWGNTNRLYVGAAINDGAIELYCHGDAVNRSFIVNILGASSSSGYPQNIIPKNEIATTVPVDYTEVQYTPMV